MDEMTHTVRTKDGGTISLTITRAKAIKLHCTECMGFEGDPKGCTSPKCALFPYRGKTLAAYRSEVKRTGKTGVQ